MMEIVVVERQEDFQVQRDRLSFNEHLGRPLPGWLPTPNSQADLNAPACKSHRRHSREIKPARMTLRIDIGIPLTHNCFGRCVMPVPIRRTAIRVRRGMTKGCRGSGSNRTSSRSPATSVRPV